MRARRLTVATVLPLFGVLSACSWFDSKLLVACEAHLKERLLAPAGYVRVSWDEREAESISVDDYLAWQDSLYDAPLSGTDRLIAEDGSPTRFAGWVDYDAPNAYGTLIRGSASCVYVDSRPDGDVFEGTVKVNGLTHLQWLVSQLKG